MIGVSTDLHVRDDKINQILDKIVTVGTGFVNGETIYPDTWLFGGRHFRLKLAFSRLSNIGQN